MASLNTAPRLLEPGLWRSDPLLERYQVKGGGSVVVRLRAGDTITIQDPQGRQVGEVIAFDKHGRPASGALGDHPVQKSTGLVSILSDRDIDTRSLTQRLSALNINLGDALAIPLFSPDSAPGEEIEFAANDDLTCLVCAPGQSMAVDEQHPPTPLVVWVRRSDLMGETGPALPDPLADPRLDFRIDRCTARDFVVRAGEFIQIIDVAGRECSDFLAFTESKLNQGIERGLDPTTTRTLMGAAYPGPGLFSKFFDQDMQPLVEVIQDTCGRHDTFGLACTSKYYEDVGYFGHPNCSDNLSNALKDYGVEARRGWPAINFFYNTGIDDHNALYLDEPWSRPGDYVLLRALDDLVCASTACPDDTSPANGWNPTEIHVRVYSPDNVFSKAIAYRMTPDAEAELTRETGFHPRTSKLTRNFTEYRGFWLPTVFNNTGAIE
ncbi:MAG TPA: DUF1989 domain-containing protein, partial [Gammaproteobacteria bacterium]|nr:DUF1989 domain-containing protein [Gammaproteobacteria bacterium]